MTNFELGRRHLFKLLISEDISINDADINFFRQIQNFQFDDILKKYDELYNISIDSFCNSKRIEGDLADFEDRHFGILRKIEGSDLNNIHLDEDKKEIKQKYTVLKEEKLATYTFSEWKTQDLNKFLRYYLKALYYYFFKKEFVSI